MDSRPLNLIKVPFRADGLVKIARARGLPLRQLDEGYLAHAVLRELWQDKAPAPFGLRGSGRRLDAWGYSERDAEELRDHAMAFGDPSLLAAIDQGLEGIVSKPVPVFPAGKLVGFQVRVCPVTRLSSGRGGKRGREVDAFLARCWRDGAEVTVSREQVYAEWFSARLGEEKSGAKLVRLRIEGYTQERFVRRTQRQGGGARTARTIERPDVHLAGNLVVQDGGRFLDTLRRGIGRHRAFGFGMVLIVPPSDREPSNDGVEVACP